MKQERAVDLGSGQYAVVQGKGAVPAGWREVRLGEVVKSNIRSVGKKYPYKEILYLDTGSIIENKILEFQSYNIDKAPSRAKRLVREENIIYSTVRPIQRHYGFIKNPPKNLVVSTGFSVIETDEKYANPLYIYHMLSSKDIVERLDVIAEGATSVYPALQSRDIENLEIILPPLLEQKAIAEVLGSLDDKIDLLHRQNKTLEAIAQTLFRKWFVEDADDGWEEVELRQFIKWTIGHSYRSKDLMSSDIALVTLKNFARDGSFRMDGFKEYTGKFNENQVVNEGDLVVAHTDITQAADVVGNPTLVYKPIKYDKLIMTMDLMKIESSQQWLSREFLYYLMKTRDFKAHCVGLANGSTVLHLSRDAVPSFRFLLPDKDSIARFSNISRDLVKRQFHNRKQISILEHLRDLLLPKLISGAIRIH